MFRVLATANDVRDTITVGSVITALTGLAGLLLRELSKSSGGAWRVVQEKNREIHRLRWETSYWQARALGDPLPAPYVEPTAKELGQV